MKKSFFASILLLLLGLLPSQAQITLQQADSIVKQHLRSNWPVVDADFYYYHIWFYPDFSDTVRFPVFESEDIVITNSYIYDIEFYSNPRPLTNTHQALTVDKTTGEISFPEHSPFAWDGKWYIKDCVFEKDIPKLVNKAEADSFLIAGLHLMFGEDAPAYTLYSYPDTSTIAFFYYTPYEENNALALYWDEFSSIPTSNRIYYFVMIEDSASLKGSPFMVERDQEGELCSWYYWDFTTTDIPFNLWQWPVTYTYLHHVDNETSPEALASAAKATLYPNVPNPFSSSTRVKYNLPDKYRSAELQIIDLQGRIVQTLSLSDYGTGETEIDMTSHAPGLYIGILHVDGIPTDRIRLMKTE